MDTLAKAVKELRINGSSEEETEFSYFKNRLIEQLKEEEREVMRALHQHHPRSFTHSMMVARDVEYIAKNMGLPGDKVQALVIAALLHDVGKLDIHEAILELGSYPERKAIWLHAFPGHTPPNSPLIDDITLRHIINYKSAKADNPKEYRKAFEQWLMDKGVYSFLDKSLLDYLKHHQEGTRAALEKIGVKEEIVELAAAHHPSYFSDSERHRLPKECCIIEVADKFNAIIQSEGVRNYISRESRTKALSIIANELKKEFSGFFRSYEKKALRVLVKRYLPPEVSKEIIPTVKNLVIHMKTHIAKMQKHVGGPYEKADADEARNLLGTIAATLALSKEFGHILEHDMESTLEHYEQELQDVLRAA